MEMHRNTGWYVLGGIALLCALTYNLGKVREISSNPLKPLDNNVPPDTATNTEIIITIGK